MNKPFSQACENNKQPILTILQSAFSQTNSVLEVGSGSGQHAVYFAANLPQLKWQTSDLLINHQGINLWLDTDPSDNLKPPIELDLNHSWQLPETHVEVNNETNTKSKVELDGIFTANTLHIVSWSLVVKFFQGVEKNLSSNGTLCIYGPFNYQGKFTSDSNAQFNLWLKDRDEDSGIRDFEAIEQLATSAGLSLQADHEMPANNRLLVFKKL